MLGPFCPPPHPLFPAEFQSAVVKGVFVVVGGDAEKRVEKKKMLFFLLVSLSFYTHAYYTYDKIAGTENGIRRLVLTDELLGRIS